VNLIGVVEGEFFDQFPSLPAGSEDLSKHDGFLYSASGRAALAKIKNYYTNIGVWIAPPNKHACFHRHFWWDIIYRDRIMEAALSNPEVPFEKIPLDTLMSIGAHARDVLGRRVSVCSTLIFIRPFIERVWPEILPWLDPWQPQPDLQKELPPIPLFDPAHLINIALGGAIVAIRQAIPYPPEKFSEEHEKIAADAIMQGGRQALNTAVKQMAPMMKEFSATVRAAAD
jgi:hypothetical protein